MYSAAADPRLWPAFLESICAETGATTAMILAADEQQRPVLCSMIGSIGPTSQQAYEEHFFAHDIIRHRMQARCVGSQGWVGVRQSILSDPELEQSEYYNDYMRPLDHYHQVGAVLEKTSGYSVAGITLLRSERDGIFGAETVSLLGLLAPHIKQAIALHQRLTLLNAQGVVLDELCGNTDIAFVALGSTGLLQSRSAAAETILRKADGLKVVNGRLTAELPQEDQTLQQLIRGALNIASRPIASRSLEAAHQPCPDGSTGFTGSTESKESTGSMLLSRRPPRKPLRLTVAPLLREESAGCPSPSAIVFLSDPEATLRSRATVLRTLFRLMPSEARMADWLLQGMDVRQAAERMQITRNSARFLLKGIFRKTGVASQSGLMKLMLTLPGK